VRHKALNQLLHLLDCVTHTVCFAVVDHLCEVRDRVNRGDFFDDIVIRLILAQLQPLGLPLLRLLLFLCNQVLPVNPSLFLVFEFVLINFLQVEGLLKFFDFFVGSLKHASVGFDVFDDVWVHFRQRTVVALFLAVFWL